MKKLLLISLMVIFHEILLASVSSSFAGRWKRPDSVYKLTINTNGDVIIINTQNGNQYTGSSYQKNDTLYMSYSNTTNSFTENCTSSGQQLYCSWNGVNFKGYGTETFNLINHPPTNPTGWFDYADIYSVSGWACDPDVPLTSIQVHLYFGGPAGCKVGTDCAVDVVTANYASELAVNNICGGGTAHRFYYSIPSSIINFFGNGSFPVYAYGINDDGTGNNPLLYGSLKTINIPLSMFITPFQGQWVMADSSYMLNIAQDGKITFWETIYGSKYTGYVRHITNNVITMYASDPFYNFIETCTLTQTSPRLLNCSWYGTDGSIGSGTETYQGFNNISFLSPGQSFIYPLGAMVGNYSGNVIFNGSSRPVSMVLSQSGASLKGTLTNLSVLSTIMKASDQAMFVMLTTNSTGTYFSRDNCVITAHNPIKFSCDWLDSNNNSGTEAFDQILNNLPSEDESPFYIGVTSFYYENSYYPLCDKNNPNINLPYLCIASIPIDGTSSNDLGINSTGLVYFGLSNDFQNVFNKYATDWPNGNLTLLGATGLPPLSYSKNSNNLINYYNELKTTLSTYHNFKYFLLGRETDNVPIGDGTAKQNAVYTRITYRAVKDSRPGITMIQYGSGIYYTQYDSNSGFYKDILEELAYMERVEHGTSQYDGRYDSFLNPNERSFLFEADNYDKYLDAHAFSDYDLTVQKNMSYIATVVDENRVRNGTLNIVNAVRNLYSLYGYNNIPLYNGETGEPTMAPNNDIIAAESLLKKHIISFAAGIKKVMMSKLYDYIWEGGPSEPIGSSGLIYSGILGRGALDSHNGLKKLSYYTYKQMVQKLDGSDWNNVQIAINGVNNIYVYKFIKKATGKSSYVVWWNYWNEPNLSTKTITIPIGMTGNVKITESVPHFDDALILQNSGEIYPNFFASQIKPVSNGQVNFTLGKHPVYIEENN